MFLICGEALFDVFPDEHGASSSEIVLRATPGGSPFNVAVGLGRLGRPVALATELSDDVFGRRLERVLIDGGVDLRFTRRTARPTPLAIVEPDAAAGHRYAFHALEARHYHPELGMPIGRGDVVTKLHLGSIPLVSEQSAPALLSLAAAAKEQGLVSLDPNVRLALEPDVELWRRRVSDFRAHAHVIKVSTEDLNALHGPEAAVEELASAWLSDITRLVVLTRGVDGATLLTSRNRISAPASSVQLVDAVGAGDSYQAALLCWLDEAGLATPAGLDALQVEDLRALARFCAEAAALTCGRRGPDLPWRAELRRPQI